MVSGAIWFRPGKSDSHAALVPQGAARSVVSRRTLTKAPTRLGDGPSFETRWLSHRSYRHEAVELAPVVAGITLGVMHFSQPPPFLLRMSIGALLNRCVQ